MRTDGQKKSLEKVRMFSQMIWKKSLLLSSEMDGGEVGMIRIDMPMPNSCLECRFRDTVQSGCNAAEEPGFCVFVGLSEMEIVEWEDWKRKAGSGRDPRCPLKQECKGCSTIFDVAYKAGKADAVVRCKDCKWYDERISMCDNCGLPREQTFFCADGRRNENHD